MIHTRKGRGVRTNPRETDEFGTDQEIISTGSISNGRHVQDETAHRPFVAGAAIVDALLPGVPREMPGVDRAEEVVDLRGGSSRLVHGARLIRRGVTGDPAAPRISWLAAAAVGVGQRVPAGHVHHNERIHRDLESLGLEERDRLIDRAVGRGTTKRRFAFDVGHDLSVTALQRADLPRERCGGHGQMFHLGDDLTVADPQVSPVPCDNKADVFQARRADQQVLDRVCEVGERLGRNPVQVLSGVGAGHGRRAVSEFRGAGNDRDRARQNLKGWFDAFEEEESNGTPLVTGLFAAVDHYAASAGSASRVVIWNTVCATSSVIHCTVMVSVANRQTFNQYRPTTASKSTSKVNAASKVMVLFVPSVVIPVI